MLLLHLLLLEQDFRLGIDGRVIHVFLIDMIIEVVECCLDFLEKLMESAPENFLYRQEVQIGDQFAEGPLLLAAVFAPFLAAHAMKFGIETS